MGIAVDERVVEMRFDNHQFERGVQSTMGALDKLKQSLKLDGASKGLDNVNQAAKNVSLDGIASGVAALEKRFSTFGIVGMRVISNLTDSMMRFGRNTVGFVTDSIIGGGKRRAMNIENAHFQLQGLLKDEAKVQAVMDDAMDSVDGTAYAYDEAAKAASQFAASGMEAGEKMQASLRAITGVVAMTNSEYESISQIFTTVSGNGRLMGDQLLQLSSRGLNAAATLADYMTKVGNGAKVTEGEVREMVSKGEISFDLFAAAMDDAFGEHAKKANETFTGAMSNVKASLSRIGAEFISPLIVQNGPLVQFFNALRERINDVKANIGPLAELFTKSVSGMAQSAAKYLQEMDLAKPFEAFYNIMDIFKNASGGISSILMPIRFAFEDIFPQSAVTALADFTSKLKEFTSNLRLSHVDAVNLRNTFQGLFAVLDIAGRIIGGVVQAIFPMTKGVGGLGSAVLMVTGQIGTWLTALDDIIKKSGVFGSAAEKIGNVTGVVSQAIGKHVKGIVKAFSDFLGIDFAAAAEARLNPFQKICEAVKLALDKLAAVFREISPVLAKFGEMIVDTLGKIGGGLQKAVHGEGFDSLIDLMNGGLMAGIGTGIMNFIGHIQKTVIKANGMFSNVNLILANVKNTLISYQAALKADVLMKIAKAVAVLAGSLFVLALIDSEKLSGALAALSVLVVELSAAMAAFGKTLGGKGVMQLASAGTMMIAFSTAILILSAALNVISGIDSDKLTGALIGITVLLGELLASSIILSKWGGKVKTSAAGMILFASAIYILTKAVKQLAQLDVKQLTKGLIGVGVLLAELSAFMFAAKFGNFKVSSGLAMIELAAALLILEKVVSGFGQMNTESMARGLAGVAGALLAVSASMRIMPKNMIALGLGLIEVSAALKIIGEVVQETGKMGWEEIGKGLTVLSGSMVILAVALQAMKGTLGAAAAMLVLSIALNVFLPCLKALGSMSLVEIGTAILALAAAFTVLGIAGAVLGPLIPAILGLSGALALFGIGVAACGAGVLALSIGLASLAASGVAGMMAFVTGLEILFVGILEIIAKSVESIANAVKAVVLAIVSVIVECAPAIVEGVLALVEEVFKALSVHAPAIVNYLMDFLIGVMNALAERLPELVQAAINLIRTFFHSVIEVLKGMDTSSLVEMVEGIGFLTAIMYALAGVAKLTPLAMKGVLGLGVVIAELAAVLAALGGLAQIPYLEWLISEGGDLLKEIGTAIGKFIGGIVGGMMSGVSSALPQIGADLSQFMENAAPFFIGMGMITADTLAKAGFLSGILLIFGAADLIAGITSFLTGGSSLPQIGTNLSDFLLNATPFFSGLALVNEGAVKAAKNLAEMIMLFTVSDFIQGITSWLTGGSSLADFGTELVAFGPSIAEFAETVKDVKPKAVKGAAASAKIMAEVADNLPGQDGLLQKIFGDKSLADFGSELLLFGPSIALFAETVKDVKPKAVKGAAAAASIMSEMASELPETGGLKAVIFGDCTLSDFGAELVAFAPQIKKYADEVADVKPEAVTATANAAKALLEIVNSLPETGGISEFFTGKKSLSNFGENLKAFGKGMSEYSKAVKEVDSGKITASANAAQTIVELVKMLPKTGGISEFFTGEKSLSNFSENLKAFGEGMSEYSKAVKEVDSGKIVMSTNAAQTIAELVVSSSNIEKFNLAEFGKDLAAFGQSFVKYYKDTSDIDPQKLSGITSEIKKLAKMASSGITKGFSDGMKTKQSAVSDIFSSILEKALSVIKKKRSNFGVEGSAVINKFVSAVKKGGNDVKTMLSVPINQSLASIRNKRPAFYSAASFLVDGFVKGVSDNSSKVSKQIQLMAEAALKSSQTALGIHSPSKVFTEIGGYVVDGFTNGIDENKEKAAESAENLAKVGVETAKSVLGSLKDSNSVFAEYVENTDENGNAVEVTLEQAAEAFKSFRNSVKDSIKDATGVFDEFKTETDIAGKQLIKNLKSQITGITEWAANMQLLAARGVNQGLLKALSDMGPSGANYVNALVTMSGKELKKMNKLYKQRLSLNNKAADEIASSFVEGGKKAAKAYDKGLTKGEMIKSGKKSLKTLAEDSVNAVSNARKKVKESFGGMFEDAVKEMKKSLDYGKGAFQQFCNIFLSGSKNIVASANAVEAASKAITAYGRKLYEESEYYKEDTKNLKAHTDSLTKLQNENSKLQKQLKKAKKSNKKDSKERVQTLKKELEANKKAISSAKDQIISDQKEIAKHTKEVYNNLRSDLSNSVAAFLDPLKASLDSGVDLFKKFESNATLYEEDKKRLAEHQKALADLEKQRAGLQEELAKYAEMNDTDSRLRWKELYGELEDLEKQIEDAKNNIKQDEDDMASHSQLTVNKILENMQSQVTGVKQWKGNINKLAGKGVSEGLIAYLKNMGTDGVDYVDQFMKMTSAEISKANAIFKESQNLSAQSLLDGFKDQMKTANDFANGLNQMAKMGFGQDLLEKLGEAGSDSYDYVKAFLTMTPQQVAEFNQEYANSLKLPNTVADKVISSFAYAGSQSAAGFTSALAKMSETGSKENAALVTATNRIGESIGVMLKSNSRTAGSDMVGELAHTLKVKKPTAEKESLDLGKATLKSVKKSISKKKGKKLAKNLVDGMSNGLTDHSSRVSKTAEEVALSAYRSAKKALGIKSPSKMFAKLGAYTDAGFIEGLASGEKDVCQTAADIMGQAIKEASDLLQSDMDTEPTIRPVMDLTEIQNGVGSIGELMNDCGVSASAKLAGFAAGGIQKPGMSMEDKNAGAISRLQETLSNLLDKPAIEQHNTFTITGNDPRAIADEVSCILQKQVERRSAVWA